MKNVMQWFIGVSAAFSAAVLIYIIIAGINGAAVVSIPLIWSLLVMSVACATLQYLAFTEVIFKKIRYSLRLIIFVVPFGVTLMVISSIFEWFPRRGGLGWMIFIGIFIAIFVMMTIGFEIYYHFAGKKYDGLLGQYKKRHNY